MRAPSSCSRGSSKRWCAPIGSGGEVNAGSRAVAHRGRVGERRDDADERENEHRHELEDWTKKTAEKDAELDKEFKKAKKDREKAQKEAEEKSKKFERS